jgi:hypothetical protein
MAAVSAPAHATLQIAVSVNGTSAECVDNTACDSNPAVGTIDATESVGGVTFINATAISTKGLADLLTTASTNIINNSGGTANVEVTVGDTSYAAPIKFVTTTASGTFLLSSANTTNTWWIDTANTQGAGSPGDTPGAMVDTFTFTGPALSYSHDNANIPFSATSPFSMTMDATFTLAAGGMLNDRGQAMFTTAAIIPEASTWVLMALGFAGLGYAGFRQTRQSPRKLRLTSV